MNMPQLKRDDVKLHIWRDLENIPNILRSEKKLF